MMLTLSVAVQAQAVPIIGCVEFMSISADSDRLGL